MIEASMTPGKHTLPGRFGFSEPCRKAGVQPTPSNLGQTALQNVPAKLADINKAKRIE
jgi:hypothetical protein